MPKQLLSKLIYLAAPYAHPDPITRNSRVELASLAAAKLMQAGFVVFSPITHGHAVADHLPLIFVHDHEFWMEQCLPMVERSDLLVVLPLSGWSSSRGIAAEICHASQHGTKVFMWQDWQDGVETVIEYCKGNF